MDSLPPAPSPIDPVPQVICGIDNGTSGSIAILTPGSGPFWVRTPVVRRRNYQKKDSHLLRVDVKVLTDLLREKLAGRPVDILLERPYCNPRNFSATLSAVRTLEATLIVLEQLGLPYRYVDSREWQAVMLPGIVGRENLKQASLDEGRRLFPGIECRGDADALLMAEWGRRHPPLPSPPVRRRKRKKKKPR